MNTTYGVPSIVLVLAILAVEFKGAPKKFYDERQRSMERVISPEDAKMEGMEKFPDTYKVKQ